MLNISISQQTRAALHTLLQKEGDEGACFRLREFVTGCGAACRSEVRRTLRLTLDTENEDDVGVVIDGLRFIMEGILLANYGNSFFVSLDARQVPMVGVLFPFSRNPQGELGKK